MDSSEMREFFFDDLQIGQIFTSPELCITHDSWRKFVTTICGAESPFPQSEEENSLVQSFVSALTMKLLVKSNFKPNGGIIGLEVEKLVWPQRIQIGDILNVESVIVGMRKQDSRSQHGVVHLKTTTRAGNNKIAQEMISHVLVPRPPRQGQ